MNIFKKLLVSILILMYTCIGVFADAPPVMSKSAILMDANSSRVLFEKNAHQRLPMASTTKIMTAIVALENGGLKDIVVIPPEASGVEGSSIWLSPEEEHTLEDLLYGLMLRSGNDAAVAIALHICDSVEDFAELMNKTAKKIGATNTNFTNPHGLHDDNHYTTAYDLTLITSYGLKNPIFEEIVSTQHKTIGWPGNEWDRAMRNKNKLLWQYEGANGVKTGYTRIAGRCLVSSAIREELQLVAVVLNCGPMFEESMLILDYGFNNYKSEKLLHSNQVTDSIPIKNGKTEMVNLVSAEGFSIALKEDEAEKVKIEIDIPEIVNAPVTKGEQAGVARIFFENQLVKEVPLLYQETVAKQSIWDYLRRLLN
ncbi:MAG TPA: D-alanyl-D-alanine carboxypeptidase family protein [Bacillota bacterium]|nr:D-alanyl-D-alanine carboxypeptidase family protein [Bacillota bacterium]